MTLKKIIRPVHIDIIATIPVKIQRETTYFISRALVTLGLMVSRMTDSCVAFYAHHQ